MPCGGRCFTGPRGPPRLLEMSSRVISWIIAVIGTITVALLVIVPVIASKDKRRDLQAVDATVLVEAVQQLAPEGDIGKGPTDLLSVRRAPGVLLEPVLRTKAVEAVAGLGGDYPEPACLSVRIDGREVLHTGTAAALIPASVQKLLTAKAVLDTIGPDERLTTRVLTTAEVVAGEIKGNLVLVGGGDPMLAQQPYADAYRRQPQLRTSMEALADAIAETGVTRVRGRIVVNDDRYDTVRFVESWPDRYLTQFNSGPIGALTVNDGFSEWEPARVYAKDPAIYAGQVLDRELNRRGVRVDGATRRGDVPSDALEFASIDSPTIGEMVQQMLRESDNNTAESLMKEMGYRRDGLGTTGGGAEVVFDVAREAGFDVSGLVVVDGSGLDRGNLVTCAVLAGLLELAGPDSTIGAGLAVAAESGTISHRFGDTDVAGHLHAKTGLLNNVNGFAGWVESVDGTIVTFAQLLNGTPLNSRVGFDLQDSLAADLFAVTLDIEVADVSLPDRSSGVEQ